MENGPFSSPEFLKFAAEAVLFVHNTSNVPNEPYPNLLAEKGLEVCSGTCIMDQEGRVLAKPMGSVAAFVTAHEQCKRVVALRAKGNERSSVEAKELFFAELALDLVADDAVAARAASLALDPGEREKVARKLTDIEVLGLFRRVHELGPETLAARLAAMAKARRMPGEGTFEAFWVQVLMHSAKAKDGDLGKQAFDQLVAHHVKHHGKDVAPLQIEQWRKMLAEAVGGDAEPRRDHCTMPRRQLLKLAVPASENTPAWA